MTATFRYDPLDSEGSSFRLLRLLRGGGPQIACEIFEAWLQDNAATPFEALSYAWGDLATPRKIKLNDESFTVMENLYIALTHLRKENEDHIMWIDAICIDQNNLRERGRQVAQMGEIFSQAERVIVWLGNSTPNVDLVMTTLQLFEFQTLSKRSFLYWSLENWSREWKSVQRDKSPEMMDRLRSGLLELMHRPWFQRVWIIQEVFRAKRAAVCAGSTEVNSRTFACAPFFMDVTPDEHCQAVLNIMPSPYRWITWWDMEADLYKLSQRFKHSKASDPRDMIYALLGILSPGATSNSLEPDYTKTEGQVIDDTTFHLFGLRSCPFRTMRKFLDQFPLLTSEAFVTKARTESADDVFAFWRLRRDHISITEKELEAAASNQEFGAGVMRIFCERIDFDIGLPIINAAAKNMKCGKRILLQLVRYSAHRLPALREVTKQVVWLARAKHGCAPACLQLLEEEHDWDDSTMTIREEFLQAACEVGWHTKATELGSIWDISTPSASVAAEMRDPLEASSLPDTD